MTSTQTALRKGAYHRIRNLSDGELLQVLDFIDTLEVGRPMNDNEEPLSEEELQALKEADAEIAAGNFDIWENVKRRLAELP